MRIDFKDASGSVVLSFNEDYLSADANAPSGYSCLGVSGGDGGMLVGSASDVVYYSSSLSRNFNGCGYVSYTTNSPATDASYTPNSATPNWDYRVVYDVWVLRSALPQGWTVSIPYVHASPSKMASTYTVTAAACPPLECVGEGCTSGGVCVGAGCDGSSPDGGSVDGGTCVGEGCATGGACVGSGCDTSGGGDGSGGDSGGGTPGCVGENCTTSGACVGLLCDGGPTTICVGEGCQGNPGLGDGGESWCSPVGETCTDDSACCTARCLGGTCAEGVR